MVSIFHGSGLIKENLIKGVVHEWPWWQIFEIIDLSVVILFIPNRNIFGIGYIQVEWPSLKVNWEHEIWINIDNIEAWRFASIGCCWAYDKVHTYRIFPDHISYHLVLFLMDVWVHTPSNYCLISIYNSMESPSKLPQALINIRDMRDNNSISIHFF